MNRKQKARKHSTSYATFIYKVLKAVRSLFLDLLALGFRSHHFVVAFMPIQCHSALCEHVYCILLKV